MILPFSSLQEDNGFFSAEKNWSSSSLCGIAGPAPIFETVKKAALQANSMASFYDLPSRIATAYAPVKESPAPVVSTNSTPFPLKFLKSKAFYSVCTMSLFSRLSWSLLYMQFGSLSQYLEPSTPILNKTSKSGYSLIIYLMYSSVLAPSFTESVNLVSSVWLGEPRTTIFLL